MDESKKKVLILYTSVGLGHKSIAENIAFQLQEAGQEVRLEDIGKVQEGKFEKVVVFIHQLINKHAPFIWAWLYKWGHYLVLPFRVFIAGFNSRGVEKLIQEYNPNLIITTQTTASAVVAFLKKKGIYKNLFGIAFSDFHLHPYWLYKESDFYLVNIPEQKEEIVRRGIGPEKIFVCGMSLQPKLEVSLNSIKQKFKISAEEKVILVGSGSLGFGFNEQLLLDLSKIPNSKILVVCGKNEEYKKYLVEKFSRTNIIPLGFYSPMAELYSISDILFTKPGGLTIAEALQYSLPIVITHTLPGQEQLNLDYLLGKKLVEQVSFPLVNQISSSQNIRNSLVRNPYLQGIIHPPESPKTALIKLLN